MSYYGLIKILQGGIYMMDIEFEARLIIAKHTAAYMLSCNYIPESMQDMWEDMADECAYILTEKFLNGEYTPIQYNSIRNQLAKMLDNIFAPLCK
jgi:hypothetical protein